MTKRCTHEEYELKLCNKEIDYWPLEKYVNAITPIKHICLKDHEFMSTPNKILSGRGCPICAGRVITQQDYKNKLKKTEFINLEPYNDDRTSILHKHLICGYEWKARPNNIINGKGCPKCSKHMYYTTDSYRNKISNFKYSVLEDFINTRTPLIHKHIICGHEWKVRPDDILKGRGCPKCATYGFNPMEEASIYLVRFNASGEIFYKIGITNRTPEKRLGLDWHEFNFKTIIESRFRYGSLARNIEQEILKYYSDYKCNTGVLRSGNSETFSCDLPIESIVSLIKTYTNHTKNNS